MRPSIMNEILLLDIHLYFILGDQPEEGLKQKRYENAKSV
jgi:hypothetical protein